MNRPRLGLIVLRVDETIEDDFRHSLPPKAARLYVTRVNSGDDLTPEGIDRMKEGLTGAAALLPSAAPFDVIGYACTSGTALIGADQVSALVSQGAPTRAVTNPLTAALAAFAARGLRRVGVVSPYVASVAEPLCAAFRAGGLDVVDSLSFGEQSEARVARIDPGSIADAARQLAARSPLDAVFLSCTNLQTRSILRDLGSELGIGVLSSNQVLAWHMALLAQLSDGVDQPA